MRSYRRLALRLAAGEEQGLRALLSGGVQSVRVVLRALALLRLSAGQAGSALAVLFGIEAQGRPGDWEAVLGGRVGKGGLGAVASGRCARAERGRTAADHRHGMQRSARGPGPLDRALGGP